MNTYSSYRLRRNILADPEIGPYFKTWMLMIVEHIDWTTGIKRFHGKNHFNNWLKSLAEIYGVDRYTHHDGSTLEPYEVLSKAVQMMVNAGYATLDKRTGTLSVMQNDEDWAEEA